MPSYLSKQLNSKQSTCPSTSIAQLNQKIFKLKKRFFSEARTCKFGIAYLAAATNIFIKWKDSGCSGLTNQTFLAGIQTISAMPELAKYLQQKLKLQYVLPRKFTSDPIEGQFG